MLHFIARFLFYRDEKKLITGLTILLLHPRSIYRGLCWWHRYSYLRACLFQHPSHRITWIGSVAGISRILNEIWPSSTTGCNWVGMSLPVSLTYPSLENLRTQERRDVLFTSFKPYFKMSTTPLPLTLWDGWTNRLVDELPDIHSRSIKCS